LVICFYVREKIFKKADTICIFSPVVSPENVLAVIFKTQKISCYIRNPAQSEAVTPPEGFYLSTSELINQGYSTVGYYSG
jgi:hypothetical protein